MQSKAFQSKIAYRILSLVLFLGLPCVAVAQISAPELLTPEDGGWRWIDDHLGWTEVGGATAYRVQVGDVDGDFDEPVIDSVLTKTHLYSMITEGEYAWRVAATDGETWSAWSDTWTFEVRFPISNEPELIQRQGALEMHVYPTPAREMIVVEIDSYSASESHIRIYNLLGQRVLELKASMLSAGRSVVDIEALARGVYVLQAVQADKSSTSLFVKQ